MTPARAERVFWLVPAAFAALRLAFPPAAHNGHTIMYALVVEARSYNAAQLFHPLWVPLLQAVRFAVKALGARGAPLFAYQALALLGACVHLMLLQRLAAAVFADRRAAWCAALLGAGSYNLWAWSLQTTSYTCATSCELFAALALLAASTPARAALCGAFLGLAAGLDLGCATLLAPAAAWLWLKGGPRRARLLLVLSGSFAAVALAAYCAPFLATGKSFAELALAGRRFVGPQTLLDAAGPLDQARLFLDSTAPQDAPYSLIFAAFAAWLLAARRRSLAPDERAFAALAAAHFLLRFAFFFACDARNRFFYSAGLFLPLAAAGLLLRLPRRFSPALAAGLVSLALFVDAAASGRGYAPARNPGLDEARFLESRLSPRDLVVSVSEPDWLFSMRAEERLRVVRVLWPGDDRVARFGTAALSLGTDLRAALDRAICEGNRAVLASDAVFRNEGFEGPEGGRKERQMISFLQDAGYALGRGFDSPAGQRYYPLERRAHCESTQADSAAR